MINNYKQFVGHTHKVFSVAYDIQFKKIATSSGDKTLKIWDIQKAICIQTLSQFNSSILQVIWENKKNYIIIGQCDGLVYVICGSKFNILYIVNAEFSGFLSLDNQNHNIRFLNNNIIRQYNINQNKIIFSFSKHSQQIYTFDICKTSNKFAIGYQNGQIEIYDSLYELNLIDNLYFGNFIVQRVQFSQSSNLFGVCTINQMIIYSFFSKIIIFRWKRQVSSIYQICFSPNQRRIAVCNQEDKGLCIYDLTKQLVIANLDDIHDKRINGLKWYKNFIITASSDCSIKMWKFIDTAIQEEENI